jgi:hypothetical protein
MQLVQPIALRLRVVFKRTWCVPSGSGTNPYFGEGETERPVICARCHFVQHHDADFFYFRMHADIVHQRDAGPGTSTAPAASVS